MLVCVCVRACTCAGGVRVCELLRPPVCVCVSVYIQCVRAYAHVCMEIREYVCACVYVVCFLCFVYRFVSTHIKVYVLMSAGLLESCRAAAFAFGLATTLALLGQCSRPTLFARTGDWKRPACCSQHCCHHYGLEPSGGCAAAATVSGCRCAPAVSPSAPPGD